MIANCFLSLKSFSTLVIVGKKGKWKFKSHCSNCREISDKSLFRIIRKYEESIPIHSFKSVSDGCFSPEVILCVTWSPAGLLPTSLEMTLLCHLQEKWRLLSLLSHSLLERRVIWQWKWAFFYFPGGKVCCNLCSKFLLAFSAKCVPCLPLAYIHALNLLFKKAFNFVLYLNS